MRILMNSSIVGVLLALLAQQAVAIDFTAALGHTEESTSTLRIGLQKEFQSRWWQTDVGALTGYWDAGYTFWKGDKGSDNHSISASPVLVYEFNGDVFKPYLEAGIGVSLFKDSRIEDRRLGSSFQFEDRLGFGVRFYDQAIGLRAIHYSNGGLKKPNNGIESYSLHYRIAL